MSKRMVGPDVIKIAATVFVIFIHHKLQYTEEFWAKFNIMMWGWVMLAAAVALGVLLWGRKYRWSCKKLVLSALAPFVFVLGICFFKKYAVTFFFLVSGYMLCATAGKHANVITQWYRPGNLVPRIVRFYVTLIPIVIIGLIIQIFIKHMTYTPLKALELFLLGGFTPGSYYVVVMAELMLVFPLLYLAVKKWRFAGVVGIIGITLLWDILATGVFKISVDAYKLIGFRLMPSMTLGIYAKETEDSPNPLIYGGMLTVGLLYLLIFPVYKLLPLPIFYQWQNASLFVGVFLCPVVTVIISAFKNVQYTDGAFSKGMIFFSNATYHIFLVQMLYYRMFGYEWNKAVDNIVITMPVNMIVCIGLGLLFYKVFSPVEQRIIKKLKG